MPIGPTTYFGKERVFVDREACIQAFRKNIQNSGNLEYNVLFYHGIAGIGKSKLQKELQKILDEEYPEIFWAAINLNTKTYREVGTFLIALRNKIQEKYKAKFYLFNIAHAIYWKKLHPEIPLLEENYPVIKEGKFVSKIIDVLNEFGPARSIWDIINNAPENIKRFFKEQAIDINKIVAMEASEIEKLLPGFFAADFTSYLGMNSKACMNSKAYIFIDTYEALWDGLRDKGGFHEKDEWIRENLIPNMKGVSWVICGRNELLWVPECDEDWKMYLEQHPVDELPESYCQEFLEDCGIENKDIQNVIIKASEGVPYYLNLSVDTYEKISKKRQPVSEDFGKTQKEIFNTFVKYLNDNEIRALKVLSVPNSWDRALFEILMRKFDSGYPAGAFSELIKFSFIKKDTDGKCSVHQLMRKSLKEFHDPTDRKNIHKYLLDFYSKKLENIDIKEITPEHENALTEAFYHAKESLEAEELCEWFISVSGPFDRAAFWQLTTPIYEEMLQILETELEPGHKSVLITRNNLASSYCNMGKYEKALSLYNRSLEIMEKVLGPQHPFATTILNNLAVVYSKVAEYEKARFLYQMVLEIKEKSLGPQHPDVATTLNDFATLYSNMKKYEKALPLYKRALEIREKTLGTQNSDVAITLNNLATLYREIEDCEKAMHFYQRSLDINEKVLGPQHPDVAATLNNLAGLYRNVGEYEKALSLYNRSLEIMEKVLGPQHPNVAATLNELAVLYSEIGEYEKALLFYKRSLEISELVLGTQHPDVAIILYNLAVIYHTMTEYKKALPLYKRALEIRENVLGTQNSDVAITLNVLATLYIQIGEREKALPLLQKSLEIYEVLGIQNVDVAIILHLLARLYRNVGEHEKALPLYQKALEIYEVLGIQNLDVAIILYNLAVIYHKMAEYKKALPLYKRALEIREKTLGTQNSDVAITLNDLAALYFQRGEDEKALPLYQKALEIYEVLGMQNLDVAATLNNLAELYYHRGEYEKELPLYQKALEIYEILDIQNLTVSMTLNNLAEFYYQRGEHEKALPLLERSLEILENKFGPDCPYIEMIENKIFKILMTNASTS